MAINEFPLPDLGEGLTEGEILKWLVSEGDRVEQNQPIVEVETAKAAVEIPAKWPGVIVKIHHPEGATVPVGTPIVSIDTGDAGPAAPAPAPAAAEEAPATGGKIGEVTATGRTAVLVGYGPRNTAAKRRPRKGVPAPAPATSAAPAAVAPAVAAPVVTAPPVPAPAPAPAPVAPAPAPRTGGPVLAKPPVRKLARDLGVDLTTVVGTGPNGSITRQDVEAAAARGTTATAPVAATAPVWGPEREQRIPIRGVRKLTAENMVRSAFTAPHVTEFLTVDVTRSMQALKRLSQLREWEGVRLSPLLLVAKACLLAIRRHPMINSTWDEQAGEIVVKEYVNLGIAAATERGLIVPNIKDAGRLTLRELADALTDLVTTARAGKTTPADMAGGTFTITNVGVFGVDAGTPILPPGEAAILALGTIREMPWVHEGEIAIRQVTTLALSFDHRIIDGELGSLFLKDVGAFLSDPEVALLGWM